MNRYLNQTKEELDAHIKHIDELITTLHEFKDDLPSIDGIHGKSPTPIIELAIAVANETERQVMLLIDYIREVNNE